MHHAGRAKRSGARGEAMYAPADSRRADSCSRPTADQHRSSAQKQTEGASPDTAAIGIHQPPATAAAISRWLAESSVSLSIALTFLSTADLMHAHKVSVAFRDAAVLSVNYEKTGKGGGAHLFAPCGPPQGQRSRQINLSSTTHISAMLNGPLFRSFHALKLNAESAHGLLQMLTELAPISAQMQSLVLQWTDHGGPNTVQWPAGLTFPHVTNLTLCASAPAPLTFEHALSFPFPALHSLEIVMLHPETFVRTLLPALAALAAPLSSLILRESRRSYPISAHAEMIDVLLDVERSLSAIDSIHWVQQLNSCLFNIELRKRSEAHADHAQPMLHKIRTLFFTAWEDAVQDPTLSLFAGLRKLRCKVELTRPDRPGKLEQTLQQHLTPVQPCGIVVLDLSDEASDATPTMLTEPAYRHVFESAPLVEELRLRRLIVPLSSLSALAKLERLTMSFPAEVYDRGDLDCALCLPALTELIVDSADASIQATAPAFVELVRRMPRLRSVQIGHAAPILEQTTRPRSEREQRMHASPASARGRPPGQSRSSARSRCSPAPVCPCCSCRLPSSVPAFAVSTRNPRAPPAATDHPVIRSRPRPCSLPPLSIALTAPASICLLCPCCPPIHGQLHATDGLDPTASAPSAVPAASVSACERRRSISRARWPWTPARAGAGCSRLDLDLNTYILD